MNIIQTLMWSPVGIRTTTLLLAFILFAVGLLVRRSIVQAVLAPLAWLLGWETAWGLTTHLVVTGSAPLGLVWWIGVPVAALAYAAGVNVEWRWLALTAGLWALWLATGWHYNVVTNPHVDWTAEALNEAAKTAWGLAYLWPMLQPRAPKTTNQTEVSPAGSDHAELPARFL
ncbi:MAG: hypothetical protein ABI334_10270 [Candidatus Dormiibacterota bacterium]